MVSVITPSSSAGMVVLRFKFSLAQNGLGTFENIPAQQAFCTREVVKPRSSLPLSTNHKSQNCILYQKGLLKPEGNLSSGKKQKIGKKPRRGPASPRSQQADRSSALHQCSSPAKRGSSGLAPLTAFLPWQGRGSPQPEPAVWAALVLLK